MRYLALVFTFVLVQVLGVSNAVAQNHDVSIWSRVSNWDAPLNYPWYVYVGEDFVLDTRYNFDLPKTFALLVGKKFGNNVVTVIPEIGFFAGRNVGLTPEVLVLVNKGRLAYFSQNQVFSDIGLGKNSFVYHWSDILFKVDKAGRVLVGPDYQVLIQTGFVEHDLGPSLKWYASKNIYMRLWPAISLGPDNSKGKMIYVGLGWSK